MMPDSSTSIPPPPPSTRSSRTVGDARRSPFTAASGMAVPTLMLLTILFEHLEKIQRINSALGYQIGTFCALGLGLLAVYHKHREQVESQREQDRNMRTEAWIGALEREGARNREQMRDGYLDLKNGLAATDKKVDALAIVASEIRQRLDDATGPQRRLGSLGGPRLG